jgi:hypothetical protein
LVLVLGVERKEGGEGGDEHGAGDVVGYFGWVEGGEVEEVLVGGGGLGG